MASRATKPTQASQSALEVMESAYQASQQRAEELARALKVAETTIEDLRKKLNDACDEVSKLTEDRKRYSKMSWDDERVLRHGAESLLRQVSRTQFANDAENYVALKEMLESKDDEDEDDWDDE